MLELRKVPMTLQKFAQRLGISVSVLYHHADICDPLSEHNKQCSIMIHEIMEAQLEELRAQQKVLSETDFAKTFDMSLKEFVFNYPQWANKLTEQNRMIRTERTRRAAENYLQKLAASQKATSLERFAKYIGTTPQCLRMQHTDIVQKLLQHNEAVAASAKNLSKAEKITFVTNYWNAQQQSGTHLSYRQLSEQCHLPASTIRRICPELVAQIHLIEQEEQEQIEHALARVFSKIEGSNEVKKLTYIAAATGIPVHKLETRGRFGHWKTRLEEHNRKVVSTRLQETWSRMESSSAFWSLNRFAREAGLHVETLQKKHQDWIECLTARNATISTIEHIHKDRENTGN